MAEGLQRLLQKLRVGDGVWLDLVGQQASVHSPLARIPEAASLFEECYNKVLNNLIATDIKYLHQQLAHQGLRPSLSNRDVLTFNALVYSMRAFIQHMQALDRRIEDVLVMRQPLDLRTFTYV